MGHEPSGTGGMGLNSLLERAHSLYQLSLHALDEHRYAELFVLLFERTGALQMMNGFTNLSADDIASLKTETLELHEKIQRQAEGIAEQMKRGVESAKVRSAYAASAMIKR